MQGSGLHLHATASVFVRWQSARSARRPCGGDSPLTPAPLLHLACVLADHPPRGLKTAMLQSCAAGIEAGLRQRLRPGQTLALDKLLARLKGDVALAGAHCACMPVLCRPLWWPAALPCCCIAGGSPHAQLPCYSSTLSVCQHVSWAAACRHAPVSVLPTRLLTGEPICWFTGSLGVSQTPLRSTQCQRMMSGCRSGAAALLRRA